VRPSLKFWSVVLAIAAMFAAVVCIPRRGYDYRAARKAAAHADIAGLRTALDAFRSDTGHYPAGDDFVQPLLRQPLGETNWHRPYLDAEHSPKDPWAHDYVYECPGRHNPNSFDLFSVGLDGRAGTDDDIVN
jgi:general secretion pathway protein G